MSGNEYWFLSCPNAQCGELLVTMMKPEEITSTFCMKCHCTFRMKYGDANEKDQKKEGGE